MSNCCFNCAPSVSAVQQRLKQGQYIFHIKSTKHCLYLKSFHGCPLFSSLQKFQNGKSELIPPLMLFGICLPTEKKKKKKKKTSPNWHRFRQKVVTEITWDVRQSWVNYWRPRCGPACRPLWYPELSLSWKWQTQTLWFVGLLQI